MTSFIRNYHLISWKCNREKAAKQAKTAMEHFKDDFVYKIRSAIREAYQRRDELNRMISGLDFGKDKYQFKITRNTGADGKYYPMFMDDSLNIDPSVLNTTMDDQMNLFSMEHENKYGELMNELIEIFIPPEGATGEELENANMIAGSIPLKNFNGLIPPIVFTANEYTTTAWMM